MIVNYEALENILAMDFSELRAIKIGIKPNAVPEELATADSRATDEAISCFVTNFANFFEQFPASFKPSSLMKADLKTYKSYLEKIIKKVNESEYSYYLVKYSQDENAELMAKAAAYIKDSKALTRRMQYWAAGEGFGDAIRNPNAHTYVVNQIEKWSFALSQGNKKSNLVPHLFQLKPALEASSSRVSMIGLGNQK